ATAVAIATESAEVSAETLQAEVLNALERANSRTPIVEISAEGSELVIKVSMPQSLVEMAFSEEARRAAVAAASRVLGRPIKLRVLGAAGGNGVNQRTAATPRPTNGPGARSRAADDPVVRRMQEKFGAQIRTVIDHREKK
ncbi:MAG: hypothetical protein ACXVZZ_04545, partial [Terriglobales bacterium]